MSPQFVDFDADGVIDIVAGIFDGSPHLVRGAKAGWGAPEQILDRDGHRIVFNQFWNFDTKKWDSTNAHDGPGHGGEGHLTSAIAFDLDGDGRADIVVGDLVGRLTVAYRGQDDAITFGKEEPVLGADGKQIDLKNW